MKCFPITVPRKHYRGTDARRQRKLNEYNRVVAKVEEHLNADLEQQPNDSVKTYLSYYIAIEIGEDPDLVQEIVYGIDCGHNGVTIVKGDLDRALISAK
ncbi:MAG: hypothetical protein ACYC5H_00680 [Methylovirgula sp.]